MALVISDRVKERTTSTGTGALALSGAATGYRAFSAVCSTNDTCYYAIEAVDSNGLATGDWETGLGTYSAANTLTRTTVNASSNAGSAVSFLGGNKNVWIDVTATHIGTYAPLASPTFTGTVNLAALITSSTITVPTGTAVGSSVNSNLFFASNNSIVFRYLTTNIAGAAYSGGFMVGTSQGLTWGTPLNLGAVDTAISRPAANSLMFGSDVAVTTTARTELNKSVTAIADNVATAVLTVTIPNAAHSGSMRVRVTGSAGAGGAIGANEATAENEYIIAFARTAGVNAVATISAAYGAAAATVAGANAITCVAAMSAVSGAVGASNTFTVNATIARAAGTATNHTCLVYAQLMNANVTGITIA